MAHLSLTGPVGPLTIFADAGAIVALDWGRAPTSAASLAERRLLEEAGDQLNAYFDGRLRIFDLPLKPQGTAFQKRVWKAMVRIPYGRTRTYGQLATALRSAARAVGGACGRNPIPIIIPCHRVVAAGGLGGYSGDGGRATKKALLGLEGYGET